MSTEPLAFPAMGSGSAVHVLSTTNTDTNASTACTTPTLAELRERLGRLLRYSRPLSLMSLVRTAPTVADLLQAYERYRVRGVCPPCAASRGEAGAAHGEQTAGLPGGRQVNEEEPPLSSRGDAVELASPISTTAHFPLSDRVDRVGVTAATRTTANGPGVQWEAREVVGAPRAEGGAAGEGKALRSAAGADAPSRGLSMEELSRRLAQLTTKLRPYQLCELLHEQAERLGYAAYQDPITNELVATAATLRARETAAHAYANAVLTHLRAMPASAPPTHAVATRGPTRTASAAAASKAQSSPWSEAELAMLGRQLVTALGCQHGRERHCPHEGRRRETRRAAEGAQWEEGGSGVRHLARDGRGTSHRSRRRGARRRHRAGATAGVGVAPPTPPPPPPPRRITAEELAILIGVVTPTPTTGPARGSGSRAAEELTGTRRRVTPGQPPQYHPPQQPQPQGRQQQEEEEEEQTDGLPSSPSGVDAVRSLDALNGVYVAPSPTPTPMRGRWRRTPSSLSLATTSTTRRSSCTPSTSSATSTSASLSSSSSGLGTGSVFEGTDDRSAPSSASAGSSLEGLESSSDGGDVEGETERACGRPDVGRSGSSTNRSTHSGNIDWNGHARLPTPSRPLGPTGVVMASGAAIHAVPPAMHTAAYVDHLLDRGGPVNVASPVTAHVNPLMAGYAAANPFSIHELTLAEAEQILARPLYAIAHEMNRAASARGRSCYRDPVHGYLELTSDFLAGHPHCFGATCRHCPHGDVCWRRSAMFDGNHSNSSSSSGGEWESDGKESGGAASRDGPLPREGDIKGVARASASVTAAAAVSDPRASRTGAVGRVADDAGDGKKGYAGVIVSANSIEEILRWQLCGLSRAPGSSRDGPHSHPPAHRSRRLRRRAAETAHKPSPSSSSVSSMDSVGASGVGRDASTVEEARARAEAGFQRHVAFLERFSYLDSAAL